MNDQVIFRHDEKSELVRCMEYTKDDYARLARCLNSFKDSNSWPDGFGGSYEFTPENVENDWKTHDFTSYFVIVAPDDENKIVGTCFCEPTWNLPDAHYVELLGVDPSYQKQKLGKAMLLRATQFATENNHRLLALDTWAGNTNAMPLYKRIGMKWRVNTTVFMESYIPPILNHPYLRKIFTKFHWYDCYKPIITQEPNLEWYDYVFEFPDKSSLTVWADKIIGKINGFHIKNESEDLTIKLTLDKSEAYIGVKEFKINLEIENQGNSEANFSFKNFITEDIEIVQNIDEKATLKPNEKKNFECTCKFKLNTGPLDLKTEPEFYSTHMVTIDITHNNITFPLSIGKIPINAVTINPKPVNFTTQSGKQVKIPLKIKNDTQEDYPIQIKIENGNYIKLDESEFDITVSKYDSQLILNAQIEKTESTIDKLHINVKNKDGFEFINKYVSIGLLHHDKALYFEQEDQMFLENGIISLALNKKCQPGANFIEVNHKSTKLKLWGQPLILGLPFQEDGSEFYSKNLDHEIIPEKKGIWLYSSAVSRKKPGIKLTRKIFLPNTRPFYQSSFVVENIGEKIVQNLAIRESAHDWPMRIESHADIIPYEAGLVRNARMEFEHNLGKSPKLLKEGWKATEYPIGCSGVIFNNKDPNIETLSLNWRNPPVVTTLPEMKPGSIFETSKVYYYFGQKWEEVQQLWHEIYGDGLEKTELVKEIHPMHKIGLNTQNGGISTGLLIDSSNPKISVNLQSDQDAIFKGNIDLQLGELSEKIEIKQENSKNWSSEVKIDLTPPPTRLLSGQLVMDSQTRIYEFPLALGFYDSKKTIHKSTESSEKGTIYKYDNGYLEFRASDFYRGQVHYLGIKGKKNLLHTFFPEVKPFLWSNRYYGGIRHNLNPPRYWSEIDYNKMKFTSKEIKKGKWEGVEFTSPIISYNPQIKGLQTTVGYLFLPDSPILLIQQEVKNHSGVHRVFYTEITANMQVSNSNEDRYWIQSHNRSDGIAEFHTNNFQSLAQREMVWKAPWVAFQGKNSQSVIGMVSIPSSASDHILPYCPNQTYVSLNRQVREISLKPQETFISRTLLIVANKIDEIAPFSHSNIEDFL